MNARTVPVIAVWVWKSPGSCHQAHFRAARAVLNRVPRKQAWVASARQLDWSMNGAMAVGSGVEVGATSGLDRGKRAFQPAGREAPQPAKAAVSVTAGAEVPCWLR